MRLVVAALCLGLSTACLLGVTASAAQQKKKGNNPQQKQGEVIGAVWEYEARETAKKTSKVIYPAGRFRATLDGKLYNPKGGQIGTYAYTSKAKDNVTLNITQGKLKGTITLVQTQINSPTWVGSWKLEDGTTAHMTLRMIKD